MENEYDVVGVGFGPANLALAVAARELDPTRNCLFLERNLAFSWHPGMLLDGSRMQISFLKDLVSMRNLASPYSFLNYVKRQGRLERFINLNEFHPSRLEYCDYLRWVANDFAGQVRYGTEVIRVSPAGRAAFDVRLKDLTSGVESAVRARNVVVAPGGWPNVPAGVEPAHVIHSSEFLPRFAKALPDTSAPARIVLAGGGQSAGEIAMSVLTNYPNAELHLIVSGYAPRPTDNSPFVNEQFYSERSARFYRQDSRRRARELADLSNANYSVIEASLLDAIYRAAYLDEVRGCTRLFVHPYARLTGASATEATITDLIDGGHTTIACDAVVLATGYQRRLDERVFGELLPRVERNEAGEPVLTASHRIQLAGGLSAGLYVQGLGEHYFGLGETLLSMLPFRTKEIVEDIASSPASYPPARHVEHDRDKIYAVIDRFKFATLVSARDVDQPVVTQLPLILDRAKGPHGTLFGHLDRTNPHARLLDDRPVTVLFNGPNSFISPRVYLSDQLPTWNSITVQVRGTARIIRDRARVVNGLCEIAKRSERFPFLPTLNPDDRRIDALIGGIVGFEIEIDELVGRFKLSQDRDPVDRLRAAEALADTAETGHRDLIGYLLDLSLDSGADPALVNGTVQQHLVGGQGNGKHQ